ncbi:MAG: ATP-binding protein, partial [Bacteroidales bacterium]|nr:ATP-binding protein [Bacteroidales bacterium]
MDNRELIKIIDSLCELPKETEWLEFKHNFHSPEEIGERLSALANSAKLWHKSFGYLIYGIKDNDGGFLAVYF